MNATTALAFAVALGQPHGPGGPAARPALRSGPVDVAVTSVSPEGRRTPAAAIEVALEAWTRSPGADSEVLGQVQVATTDAKGRARFESAGGDARLRAVAVHRGLSFSADVEPGAGGNVAPLVLYEPTADRGDLEGTAQVSLSVRDAFVIVDLTLVLETKGLLAVDLARGPGPARLAPEGEGALRLPLPLPALFGAALDRGLLPDETVARHVATRDTPTGGRYVFAEGAVWYAGTVLPGSPRTVQARYALPIAAEEVSLAFSSPVPLETVVVTLDHADRIAPRVTPGRPFLAVSRRDGEELQSFLRLEGPLAAGDDLVLRIEGLPRQAEVYTEVAMTGAAVLFACFLLAVLAGLRSRAIVHAPTPAGAHARGA